MFRVPRLQKGIEKQLLAQDMLYEIEDVYRVLQFLLGLGQRLLHAHKYSNWKLITNAPDQCCSIVQTMFLNGHSLGCDFGVEE